MRWTELTLSPAAFAIRAPVQWVVFPGWFFQRQRDDPLGGLGAQRLDARGTRLVAEQAIEPLLEKALLPAPNAGLGLGRAPHDLIRADAIGGQQHDLSPPRVFLTRVPILNEASEPTDIDR
jgi:hypothetical protein